MVQPAATVETAGWGRRLLALAVDWLASTLVIIFLIGTRGWSEEPGFYVLGVFTLESALLTPLLGGSFGKLATGLRVVRLDGGSLDLGRSVLRAVLVSLAIPPLVFKPDGRGLHDLAVGSATVRRPPPQG